MTRSVIVPGWNAGQEQLCRKCKDKDRFFYLVSIFIFLIQYLFEIHYFLIHLFLSEFYKHYLKLQLAYLYSFQEFL